MTVFVKGAAQNLAVNIAAIANKTVTTTPIMTTPIMTTPMVQPSSTGLLTTTAMMSTAMLIADPTNLRHELDERMKKLGSAQGDY